MDARGDLFSLGCILYQGLTGELPFPARSRAELVAAHERSPQPPSRLAADISPELDTLVMGLLQPHPRDRVGHASDVAAALADTDTSSTPVEEIPRAKAYLYQ